MERVYYPIDEETAKLAHEMMSWDDYEQGSRTEVYKQQVDKCYDLADRVSKERPDRTDEAWSLATSYAKKLAENMNQKSRIGTMCPSIMISGAGNFPVKKKEKQNAAMDRNMEEYMKIMEIPRKIEGLLYGKQPIMSGDKDAVSKLEDKIAELTERHEHMKAVNAWYKKNGGKIDGCPLCTDEEIQSIKIAFSKGWNYSGRPYQSFELANNNQNLKRYKERLEVLKNAKSQETSEESYELFEVIRNSEIMRLQLVFDGKPDEETRAVLKKNGFKWAPSQSAWQRQLTDNAEIALKRVVKELKKGA